MLLLTNPPFSWGSLPGTTQMWSRTWCSYRPLFPPCPLCPPKIIFPHSLCLLLVNSNPSSRSIQKDTLWVFLEINLMTTFLHNCRKCQNVYGSKTHDDSVVHIFLTLIVFYPNFSPWVVAICRIGIIYYARFESKTKPLIGTTFPFPHLETNHLQF